MTGSAVLDSAMAAHKASIKKPHSKSHPSIAALLARSVAGMTGSAVLEGAVAAYRATDARGLDTLPAGVLLTAAHRGTLQGHMDGNPRAMSMCDAQHADFDAAECRGRFFPSAYTIPAWSAD